jgi:hypothetical protein
MRETHPMLGTLDDERTDRQLVVEYPYFGSGTPTHWVNDTSYLGSARLENVDNYEWPHPISEVVNSLIGAGMRIEHMDELRHLDWRFFSWMEEADGAFVLPEEVRDRVPLQYSILAHKPE